LLKSSAEEKCSGSLKAKKKLKVLRWFNTFVWTGFQSVTYFISVKPDIDIFSNIGFNVSEGPEIEDTA
jgi:hypothetical protein